VACMVTIEFLNDETHRQGRHSNSPALQVSTHCLKSEGL